LRTTVLDTTISSAFNCSTIELTKSALNIK
jgi:hypothetical protein